MRRLLARGLPYRPATQLALPRESRRPAQAEQAMRGAAVRAPQTCLVASDGCLLPMRPAG